MGPLGLRGQLRSSEGFRGPTCYVGREEGCKGDQSRAGGEVGVQGFRVLGLWLVVEFGVCFLFGNFEGRLGAFGLRTQGSRMFSCSALASTLNPKP